MCIHEVQHYKAKPQEIVSPTLLEEFHQEEQMGIYTGIEDASLQNTVECHTPID